MALTLFFHPLSSYCHKVLIALYENETPFEPVSVNLGDPDEAAALRALWPVGKFPVVRDGASGRVVPESSIVIEYLDRRHPGPTRFIPADPDLALETRLRDRFIDIYVHGPLQKVVDDVLRPAGSKDPLGVERARAELARGWDMLSEAVGEGPWMMGEAFTLADCAAAPALFYASRVLPFGAAHAPLAAYLERVKARPSYARVLREAEPYFGMLPI
ncbi:MAG: glutathione S-transferase family protein [Pseudomonadota bacterium]